MNIKDLVKPGMVVVFTHYQDGNLWYGVTEEGNSIDLLFGFPVPVDEAGAAKFFAKDKAILFMRYIRKHLALIAEAKGEVP